MYLTKGSGSNGVNTVYFVDTTGKACPNGVGLPQPGATLPTAPIAYDPTLRQTGVTRSNMCILKGFPTAPAKNATTWFPFGIWFANPTTLYVADEGDGSTTYSATTGTYTDAAAQTTAGLQKWVFDARPESGSWRTRCRPGSTSASRTTSAGYPTGTNSGGAGSRGRRPPTACGTSPARSTATAQRRSGPSPRL